MSYQLKQPTLRVIIMPISHHMPCQLVYPFCEQSYLNFSRACVSFTEPKFTYDFCLFLFVQIITPVFPVYFSKYRLFLKSTDYSISLGGCKFVSSNFSLTLPPIVVIVRAVVDTLVECCFQAWPLYMQGTLWVNSITDYSNPAKGFWSQETASKTRD